MAVSPSRPVPQFLPLLLALLLFPLAAIGQGFPGSSQQDFLPVHEAFPFNALIDDGDIILSWQVTPEHYLYRDNMDLQVTPADALDGDPDFSVTSTIKDDPYFGEVPVFTEDVQMRFSLNLPAGTDQAEIAVTWQGCAEAGLCYPPETERLVYSASDNSLLPADESPGNGRAGAATTQQTGGTDSRGGFSDLSASGLQTVLQNDSLLLIALIFYLLGLGLTFTPCVLPMIPIVSAVVAGQRQLRTSQAFLLSLAYVLGMALTYAAAGVLVGLLGASFNVQAWLQSPVVLALFAGLFVLFALAMFGLFELRMPRVLQDRLTQQSQQLSGGRVASVFGIGSLSALIVSPCVTAPLAAALVFISATQDAVIGGVALLWLGLGMGTPLLLIGTGGQKFIPKAGPWMDGIKAVFGVLMLGVAIWLLERVVPGPLALGLWAMLLAISGVQLGAFEPVRAGWPRTRKGFGLLLFVGAVMLMAGALGGANDPTRPLAPFLGGGSATETEENFERFASTDALEARMAQAREQGEPVILDLYADWCVSCKIMERRVFSDPDVTAQMNSYTRLQLDVTNNTASHRELMNQYGLFGPPSLLFFTADGEEIRDLRVVGEMNRRQFSAHMDQVNRQVLL